MKLNKTKTTGFCVWMHFLLFALMYLTALLLAVSAKPYWFNTGVSIFLFYGAFTRFLRWRYPDYTA